MIAPTLKVCLVIQACTFLSSLLYTIRYFQKRSFRMPLWKWVELFVHVLHTMLVLAALILTGFIQSPKFVFRASSFCLLLALAVDLFLDVCALKEPC